MQQRFLGVDHIDVRVRAVAQVQAFYERLMPALGLPTKRFAYVDEQGEWHNDIKDGRYNAVEFVEDTNTAPLFMGFIEDRTMQPTDTRIAFRIGSPDELAGWHDFLISIGAVNVELSADPEEYPAVFFEDACGTKLEVVARRQP